MEETIFLSIVIITIAFAVILTGLIIILNKYHKGIEQKNKEIYASILDAEEKERERISRDIHDELGGLITSSRLSLGSIELEKLNDSDHDKIKSVISVLELASKTARNVSMELSPEAIQKYGLSGALNSLKQIYSTYNGKIEIQCELQKLETKFEIALYRIASEMMNNAIKYSKAKNITLKIIEDESRFIHIIYDDDGIGFSYKEGETVGNGLNNIKYRCEILNGKFELTTSTNMGCKYHLTFKQK